MTNGATAPQPATVRKKTGVPAATAWDLAESLQPLPRVKRPTRRYQPTEQRHYPAIVEFVYQSRFADRHQIERHFPEWLRSERTAQYQLAALVDLGYLGIAHTRVLGRNHFVYFVTAAGVRLIRDTYATLKVDWRVDTREENRARGRGLRTLVHELMLTELELAVRLTVDVRPDLQVLASERRYYRTENHLRFTYQSAHHHVEPDAGFVLAMQRPDREPALLLHLAEMDRGWMSLRRIGRQFDLYARWGESAEGQEYLARLYAHFGVTNLPLNFRLLVVAHDATRRGGDHRRLAALFGQALALPGRMRDRMWLTTAKQLQAYQRERAPLAAPLWYRVRDARDWLADYHACLAARRSGEKIESRQRTYVEARLSSMPLHPLFPHPVAPGEALSGLRIRALGSR